MRKTIYARDHSLPQADDRANTDAQVDQRTDWAGQKGHQVGEPRQEPQGPPVAAPCPAAMSKRTRGGTISPPTLEALPSFIACVSAAVHAVVALASA